MQQNVLENILLYQYILFFYVEITRKNCISCI